MQKCLRVHPCLFLGSTLFMQYINKRIQVLLLVAFIIQMLTAWHTYFFHSDEYFQIIEFASYKLGLSPVSVLPWEFSQQIRPTIQPYIFIGLYKFLVSVGITNRFFMFSMVHVLVGMLGFVLCNYLVIKKFGKEKYLFLLLLLTNFLGLMPFLRCSFSAEAMGGLFLMLSILILEKALKENESFLWAFIAGVLMAFSFYFRFQVAFCFIGLGIWFIVNHSKAIKKMLLVNAGFLVGVGINMCLDIRFYGKFCFTPYNYFYANIVQGKAASFGTSPWWYYIAILAALTVPLLSIFLFGLFAKSLANFKNPYAVAMLFFVVGHSAVGHKEERFVFPVLFFMVYLAAEAYRSSMGTQAFISTLWTNKYYGWLIKGGVVFSIMINVLFVILLAIEPYKQPVKFIKTINEEFKEQPQQEIVSYKQSPYHTESNLDYHFLSENKLNITVIKEKEAFLAALNRSSGGTKYYTIKYEDAMNDGLESLVQDKKGIVSSGWIWSFANWLGRKYHVYIPDIWLLSRY